jgi:hypothetical protein
VPLFHLDYAGRSSTLPHFRSTKAHEEQMANAKTATLSFRIEPCLKDALRAAAAQEHRSIANMVEVLIREHCGRVGVAITDPAVQGRQKTSRTK